MSDLALGYLSFPVLLGLIFARAPIGLAMFAVGFAGFWAATGSPAIGLAKLKSETWTTFANYNLSIIPMFLLMGQFAALSGMSRALFKAAEAWLGHRPGGVAMAAVGACAGFGAICGSSLATAATMSRVALPELRRTGHSGGFSTAALAAGGTLGILIPPSVILVIYAILTESNIATLFLAAVVPGVLAAVGYMVTIAIYARVHPDRTGRSDRLAYGARFRALGDVWQVVLVFVLVVGGIYWGWFTPTEGAAVGAFATGLIALFAGGLTWRVASEALLATAASTGMIYLIIFGAAFYNGFLALSQLPQDLTGWVVAQGFAPMTVMVLILVFYLVLGCLMDSLSMILLTIPIFWPVMQAMEWGMSTDDLAIWFGILVLIVVEVGLITPPVGLNLFIINTMDRATKMVDTYRAVAWFIASDIVRVVILLIFPAITLFLV